MTKPTYHTNTLTNDLGISYDGSQVALPSGTIVPLDTAWVPAEGGWSRLTAEQKDAVKRLQADVQRAEREAVEAARAERAERRLERSLENLDQQGTHRIVTVRGEAFTFERDGDRFYIVAAKQGGRTLYWCPATRDQLEDLIIGAVKVQYVTHTPGSMELVWTAI